MAQRPILRRTISISAAIVALPLWLVLSPVWIVVAIIVDAVGGLRRLPTLRLCLFAAVYLVHSWIGVGAATWLWLSGSLGRRLNLDAHRRLQAWWAGSLLDWAGRLLDVELDFGDVESIPRRNLIVLSRHASMVDAVIPAGLITGRLGRYVHYVIKRELRWDPSLDLFGSRLGNHFVARGANTETETTAIARLATQAGLGSALVIFPEGTYATSRSRQRVMSSLRRHGTSAMIAEAEALQALLPPKPAGTLALLSGRPDADVMIIGHVGLAGVAELRGLRRGLPLAQPVMVRWWIHPRRELPTTEEALSRWLSVRWVELDRWVTETTAARAVTIQA